MSGNENPRVGSSRDGSGLEDESYQPGRMSADMRRKIKVIDPMYPHDALSAFQVGFTMFFVFLGAQALGIVLFSAELTSLQLRNSVLFATLYVITQMVRRPSRIAWLRRKGRLSASL